MHTLHTDYTSMATQRDIQHQKDKNHMIVIVNISTFPLVCSITDTRLHKHF